MRVNDLFVGAAVWAKVSGERRRVVVLREFHRATRGRQMTGRQERAYIIGTPQTKQLTGETRVKELNVARSSKQLHKCGHGYDAFAPLGVKLDTVPVCLACEERFESSRRDNDVDETSS
jgi:hypothetical protein